MKFIISRYSPKMIMAKQFTADWHELSEDEFQAIAYDAYSCIGAEDIAKLTGFTYNKEPVRARIGDLLLLADYNDGTLVFWCIQIRHCDNPLLRTDELECEEYEEMI